MTGAAHLWLALSLPLAGALVIPFLGTRPNLRDSVSVSVAILLFLVVAAFVPAVMAGARPTLSLLEMAPSLSIRFSLEPLGLVFALVASGLWIVTAFYAIGYMRAHEESHQTRFFTCFAVAIFAAVGVACSANLITLFIFYEVLTLSTYPLVTHHGTDKARKAGRVYLGILLSTSIGLFLPAIIVTYALAGTLDFQPGGILTGKAGAPMVSLLLVLYAFGIGKAALMPFHRWLPAAMVAPTPVSALLHAVAVVKAGVFSIVKISVYIFGTDLIHETGAGTIPLYAAGFTILIASLIALTRDNLKARLAYSTISQLSYIVLGAMLATGIGVIGSGMHIVMHAVGKITLFFCAGAIYVTAHKTLVSELDGLGRIMPFTFMAFLLGSLSIIGLPPMGGCWSKWHLVLGAAEGHHYFIIGILMLSTLLNIAYLLPIVVRGFFAPAQAAEAPARGAPRGIQEAPLLCVVPLCLTAVGSLALFFYAGPLYSLLLPLAQPGVTP
jgi:multicomponent Na+:H+ antiporter subunit D